MSSSDLENEFSWSVSRHNIFKECKRKYYFNHYGFWNGWKDDASDRKRLLYRLKKLENRYTWKGNTVHEAIAFLLKARLQNKNLDWERFESTVIDRMRDQYKTSLGGDYKADPKGKFGLLEHEYGEDIEKETWVSLKNDIIRNIRNFRDSVFWEKANKLSLKDCLALEGDLNSPKNIWKNISTQLPTYRKIPSILSADHFYIDGLKVWTKLDFSYSQPDGTIRLVDWKTSNSGSEPDSLQLNIYGYYAAETWGISPEQVKLTVFNIPQQERYDRKFSENQKKETRESIIESAEEMKSLLINPKKNEAQKGDFPKIDNDKFCRYCRYRRVCRH